MMDENPELEETAPLLLLIMTVAGGVLRILLLDAKTMWLDETVSVWLANRTLPDMLHWIARIDPHPPLYYLLLHYWIALNGIAPYDVRLLSALFGAAAIPVIYLIGRRLSGVTVGLVAALFLAFSPFNIYYAQEARMYTLLVFNAAVAIYALARLLTDRRAAGTPIGGQVRQALRTRRVEQLAAPEPTGEFSYANKSRNQEGWRASVRNHLPALRAMETDLAWLLLVVFSAATLWTHNTAVFFVLAANLFVVALWLVQKARPTERPPALQAPSPANWIKAQLGILLLWSPWIAVFIQQARRVDQEFWIPPPTVEAAAITFQSLLNAYAPGQAFQLTMVWLLCGVLLLGLVYYRKRLSIFFFLAALFAVPFLGELIVSLRRPIFFGRTLIWITIPLFLLLAAGIAQLRYRLLMIVVVGIIATNYLFSAGDYFRFYQKEDWPTAAGYVAQFAEKDDLVLFNSNFVVIPFNYYFDPYAELYDIEVFKQGVPLDLFESGVLEPKMAASDTPDLASLIEGHDRVWLVYSHDAYTDPQGLVPQTLAAHKQLVRTREFRGGQVQLYETP